MLPIFLRTDYFDYIALLKYSIYLSALRSEYVNAPADTTKNKINPAKMNSTYLTVLVLVFTFLVNSG
jgi:hypothetical protein